MTSFSDTFSGVSGERCLLFRLLGFLFVDRMECQLPSSLHARPETGNLLNKLNFINYKQTLYFILVTTQYMVPLAVPFALRKLALPHCTTRSL